jgi:exopolysaccharide biosynthesis polyprenyl glycosylphosphotransferase
LVTEKAPHAGLTRRLSYSLVVLDALVLVTSFSLAAIAWPGVAPLDTSVSIAALIIYLALATKSGAYSGEMFALSRSDRIRATVSAGVGNFLSAIAMVIVLLFLLRSATAVSRAETVLGTICACTALAAARYWWAQWVGRRWPEGFSRVAIIVDEPSTVPREAFSIVIYPGEWLNPRRDSPEMYEQLSQMVNGCERVVVACRPERRQDWRNMLQGFGMRVEMLAPELVAAGPLALDRFFGVPTLVIDRGPLKVADRFAKRAIDVLVSATALVLLAPLMLAIAIAIKLDSEGPVLFHQKRLGHANRSFQLLKFRTMQVVASDSEGRISTARDDGRITRLGKFLRRTSLDELPQLLNVLVGSMSLVGPRPHALGSRAGNALFWDIDQRYWHRHAMKPGITGLAQIRGFRGATETRRQLLERLNSDLEYLENWSMTRDFLIMFQTLRVLVHENAY